MGQGCGAGRSQRWWGEKRAGRKGAERRGGRAGEQLWVHPRQGHLSLLPSCRPVCGEGPGVSCSPSLWLAAVGALASKREGEAPGQKQGTQRAGLKPLIPCGHETLPLMRVPEGQSLGAWEVAQWAGLPGAQREPL